MTTRSDRIAVTRELARAPVSFQGTVVAGPEVIRSPVSGQVCAHWRLRIVEHLTSRTQLVHQMSSAEPFELDWPGRGPAGSTQPPPARIRLEPDAARIHATPVLHREGTPGALAAARAFGFAGPVSVEEVVIREGETVTAQGILDDPGLAAGPFRATSNGLELTEATVRVESRSLGPVLLPWALGTAAALLGGMGLATYAAWRLHVLHLPLGASAHAPRVFTPQPRLERPEYPHPRMP